MFEKIFHYLSKKYCKNWRKSKYILREVTLKFKIVSQNVEKQMESFNVFRNCKLELTKMLLLGSKCM